MRRWRAAIVGVLLGTIALGPPVPARAGTLAGALNSYLYRSLTLIFANAPQVADVITPIVERAALQGIDFPVTGTTPGVTYTFNPEFGTFERSEGSLGPVFAERADTIGAKQLGLGFSYLYANLTDFNGEPFGPLITQGFQSQVDGVPTLTGLFGEAFSLKNDVYTFSATYGITDRWDVNLLLPLYASQLFVSGTAIALVGSAGIQQPVRTSANAFGPGDLLVRTKYRFAAPKGIQLAGSFTMRFPSGNPLDFRGLGDYILTPGLIASRAFGRNDVHANLGLDIDANDLQRCRARYAVGVTVQPWERVAFPIDVIGSSSFRDDDFTSPTTGQIVPMVLPSQFVKAVQPDHILAFVPQSNVINIAMGVKANPWRNLVFSLNAIVPLTNDGLRGGVIPAGGIEYTF